LKGPSTSGSGTAPAGLPRPRAFVVQLASDAEPAGGTVRGRAIHIASGEASAFESITELLRFLEAAISRAEDGH
jgi:hypothetical protein